MMEQRIAFFVQLLRDRALLWAQAALKANPDITYAVFLSKFKNVFEKESSAEAAALRLLNLKQGKRSMADYSIDFQILAEETGWDGRLRARRSSRHYNLHEPSG